MVAAIIAAPTAAPAATNLSGVVVDSITGRALPGSRVEVRRGGQVMASAVTGSEGAFQLFVELPAGRDSQTLELISSREGYEATVRQATVTGGRPDALSYRLVQPRREAADCVPNWTRTVVIGFVRPPVSSARELALSRRISEVLQYDLLAEVQKSRLPSDQQPVVMPCPKAEPRDLLEHPLWARALKVDAFVAGAAEPVDQRFRVDLQVSAGHGEIEPPAFASTPPLNLDRPQSADLGRAALTPIVLAVLKAYRADGKFAHCVEFAGAAQRVLGANAEVAKLRDSCQGELPNNGLLVGGGGR